MTRPTRARTSIAVALLSLLAGCKPPAEEAEDAYTIRETKIELLECDAARAQETLDADDDGKPDVYIVREGGREACRRVDLDQDGFTDRTTYFGETGQIERVESDFDRDGRVDEIALYSLGVVTEKHRATTLDGRLDTWEFYQGGRLVRTERDENGDGVIDQWWDYASPKCPIVHVDVDADGRPDPEGSLDYCKATGEQVAEPNPTRPNPASPRPPFSGAAPPATKGAMPPPPPAQKSPSTPSSKRSVDSPKQKAPSESQTAEGEKQTAEGNVQKP